MRIRLTNPCAIVVWAIATYLTAGDALGQSLPAGPAKVEVDTGKHKLDVFTYKPKKAKDGPVDPGTVREMEATVDKLEKSLRKNVNDLPFSEYTEGKRYLTQLRDGLKALREPNAHGPHTDLDAV